MARQIPIDLIDPLHAPADPVRHAKILRKMKKDGRWNGRPLVVAAIGGRFRALTGAHRYAAGRSLNWTEIPCVVIEGMTQADYERIRTLPDPERAKALRDLGFIEPADEIDKEISANRADRADEAKGKLDYE
jgi:ParB-like chromosome segregation protein Spo0J